MGLKPILRYIGLASKVYCLQLACCHNYGNDCSCNDVNRIGSTFYKYTEKTVCKGSSKFSMATTTFDDYLSCLETKQPQLVQDFRIISRDQNLTTKFVQKRAFSGFDDKRYLLRCGIHSYPFSEENQFECDAEECMH